MSPSLTANRLLAALDPADRAFVGPDLDLVTFAPAAVLYEHGDPMEHVYFPNDAVVSVVAALEDGMSPEMTTIGREGAAGIIALLGPWNAFGRYTVQLPGSAYRIAVKRLSAAAAARPPVQTLLFRYFQALVAQTFQAVACNAAHPIEARCCRWILMTHDRVGRDELPLTHEFLAAMLGVQRPTVSIVTRTLQTASLIAQRRKAITVLDRTGLEEASCECYGHIRQMMDRILPMTYRD